MPDSLFVGGRRAHSPGRVMLVATVLVGALSNGFLSAGQDPSGEGERLTAQPVERSTAHLMREAALTSQDADAAVVRRRRVARRVPVDRRPEATHPDAQGEVLPFDPAAAVTVSQSFVAATLVDVGSFPPDPSGAAGPTQVLVAANGRLRSFSKASGAADGVVNLTTDAFFTPVRAGFSTFGPSVRYDRLAGRWFIVMATDAVPGRIVLAVSNSSTITGSTLWSMFSFDNTFSGTSCVFDSPTLGVDNAALYIGVIQFCNGGTTYAGTSGFVVSKASSAGGGPVVVTAFHNLTGTPTGVGPFAPRGVDNDDPAATEGYFVGVDNASLSTLIVRRVSTPGGTPTLSGNLVLGVATTALPILVRHAGNLGGTSGYLDGGDDRLSSASVRNGRLWTSQTIGVTHTGQASGAATRNGIRWYEIGSLTGTPSQVQSGTLFSNAMAGSFDERNYWVPSIAANGDGRVVVGYSAAGTNEFVNAGVAERLSGDAAGTLRAPELVTAAAAAYNPAGDPGSAMFGRRWGSSSTTIVDACDGSSVWTLQQFTNAADSYGLYVARTVGPPPATPVSVAPSAVASGVASINLAVTATAASGARFFDTGAFYACRIAASLPGVTVNSVTVTGLTTATVNISTVGAIPGNKTLTITNPDGQSRASSAAVLMVVPGPWMSIDYPAPGTVGQPATVIGFAVDGNAATGTGVDTVHVYANPQSGSPVFLGAATYGIARADVAQAYGSRFLASGFSLTASSSLPPGPYTIVAHAHSLVTGTFNNSASVAVALAGPTPPFGAVDTPTHMSTVTGEMGVTGWALDDAGVTRVDVYRSPVAGEGTALIFLGQATQIQGARPDIQAAFPGLLGNDRAGWGLMVLTNMLPNQGNGTFDIHAFATDNAGLVALLGTKRVTAANSTSTRPFGTIDTPGQGATVSGTIQNFGWALVPQPRIIPTNGSTIDVYIDGVLAGHPVYNQNRPDIAALFPGLQNSNGAGGSFAIDTTQLANGIHTISWVVRDDQGQATGMGSRFFRVQN